MLTVTNETTVFDAEAIQHGDVIRLKYKGDNEAVNGIVSRVTPDALTVFYLPKMANVSNYIVIRVQDIGQWESIQWSRDFTEIFKEEAEDDDEP